MYKLGVDKAAPFSEFTCRRIICASRLLYVIAEEVTMNVLEVDVRNMGSRELLAAYTLFVEVHHYVPCTTPADYTNLYNAGVTLDALHDEVMRRLGGFAVMTGRD